MSPRTVAIIQARMGSSRLPGKVLMEIEGRAMLGRVVDRVRLAKRIDAVILATSTDAADDAIAEYCGAEGIAWTRGSHFDVLDRYYQAALANTAARVVRITADCPLIDPDLIDAAVDILAGDKGEFSTQGEVSPAFDFVANRLPPPYPRTYPIGLDVEVCTFDALERAWREARDASDREHVMPYLYRGVTLAPVVELLRSGMSPRGFRVAVLDYLVDLGTQRWTVDTGEDLDFVNQVYSHFSGRSDFSWLEVLELLRRRPDLLTINADIRHKALGEVDPRAIGHDGK